MTSVYQLRETELPSHLAPKLYPFINAYRPHETPPTWRELKSEGLEKLDEDSLMDLIEDQYLADQEAERFPSQELTVNRLSLSHKTPYNTYMENTTQSPATTRLTSAEAYKRHTLTVRRNAAIERQRLDYQGDIARIQALYADGAPRKAPVVFAPQFTEAATRTVTRLAGGLKASAAAEKGAATRRTRRVLDQSAEAVAKREARRARRAARKARQAAAQGVTPVQLTN